MKEFTNILISGILKACSMSNNYTIALAKEYRKDPLLKFFSVPHVKPVSVDLDIKFAINSSSGLDKKSLLEDLDRVEEIYKHAPEKIFEFFDSHFSEIFWENIQKQEKEKILSQLKESLEEQNMENLPKFTFYDPRSISAGLIAQAREILFLTLSKNKKFSTEKFKQFLSKKENSELWEELHSNMVLLITEIVDKSETHQKNDINNVNFIFATESLDKFKPEQINSMKLSLEISSKEWATIDTENGNSYEKLY